MGDRRVAGSVVTEILGHSQIGLPLSTYGQQIPSRQHLAADRLRLAADG